MRNLKRALSLALASVMLLGMMVVGASAAGYPDVDENDNIEAIEVLNAVKVMIGDRGNFAPDRLVTRNDMAVIMAKLVLGVETADSYVGSHPFTDVVPWADKYVAACYENGLVAGTSATTYGGSGNLTAVQAAAMMLRALGYKDLSKGASDWRAPVTAMANQIRLFSGVASNPSEQLTRNQVAQLALNTLKSPVVDLIDGTFDISNTQGNNTITITGGAREYKVRSSNEAYARAINSTERAGTSASNIEGWTVELGEHLYNGKLKMNDNAQDDFCRPSINWQYDGKDIGTYVNNSLKVAEYKTKVTGSELYDLLTYVTIRDNDLLTYVDGVATNVKKDELVRSNKSGVNQSGTGVLTEVFVNHSTKEITVTAINTYLAKANSDYNKSNESLSMKVYEKDSVGQTKIVDSAVVPEAVDVVKDDYRLVYMSGRDNAANYEVVKMFDIDIIPAASITKWSKSDSVVVGDFIANGSDYKTNVKGYYDRGNVLTDYDLQLLTDMSYNIYLDRYGNAIGVDLAEGTKNYVFITGYDRLGSNIAVRTADAAAIFMDGTMDVITVNVTDTNKNIEKSASGKSGQFEKWQNWGQDAYGVNGRRSENRWYTYTVSSNGVYTLKPVDKFFWTDYADLNNGTVTEKVLNTANLFVDDSKPTSSIYNNQGRAYGNDNSVYITVEVDKVDTGTVGNQDYVNAITDVEGVYTGAQNVKLELKKDYRVDLGNLGENNAAYVYSIYDSNYYIIASVVLGEAQGAAANYAYILGDAKNERIEYSGSRASSDATYYWEFDAVLNGEKQTLTAKTKFSPVFSGLEKFHVQELRFDGEYVVKIDDVKPGKVMLENDKPVTDKMDVYDVGHVQAVDAYEKRTDTGNEPAGDHPASEYSYSSHRINGTIELVGRTLYTERVKGSNNQYDVGLALTSGAKAVLVQYENNDRVVTNCSSVSEAVGRLADADKDVPGTQFRGRVVAALESNGAARWVVIISDTPLNATNPGYGNSRYYLDLYDDLSNTNMENPTTVIASNSKKDDRVISGYIYRDSIYGVCTRYEIPAGYNTVVIQDRNIRTDNTAAFSVVPGSYAVNWFLNARNNTLTIPALSGDVRISNLTNAFNVYNISVVQTVGGTVSAPASAAAGETVTVIATPAVGYKLDAIIVNGTAIPGDTFTMSAADATVSATFVKDETPAGTVNVATNWTGTNNSEGTYVLIDATTGKAIDGNPKVGQTVVLNYYDALEITKGADPAGNVTIDGVTVPSYKVTGNITVSNKSGWNWRFGTWLDSSWEETPPLAGAVSMALKARAAVSGAGFLKDVRENKDAKYYIEITMTDGSKVVVLMAQGTRGGISLKPYKPASFDMGAAMDRTGISSAYTVWSEESDVNGGQSSDELTPAIVFKPIAKTGEFTPYQYGKDAPKLEDVKAAILAELKAADPEVESVELKKIPAAGNTEDATATLADGSKRVYKVKPAERRTILYFEDEIIGTLKYEARNTTNVTNSKFTAPGNVIAGEKGAVVGKAVTVSTAGAATISHVEKDELYLYDALKLSHSPLTAVAYVDSGIKDWISRADAVIPGTEVYFDGDSAKTGGFRQIQLTLDNKVKKTVAATEEAVARDLASAIAIHYDPIEITKDMVSAAAAAPVVALTEVTGVYKVIVNGADADPKYAEKETEMSFTGLDGREAYITGSTLDAKKAKITTPAGKLTYTVKTADDSADAANGTDTDYVIYLNKAHTMSWDTDAVGAVELEKVGGTAVTKGNYVADGAKVFVTAKAANMTLKSDSLTLASEKDAATGKKVYSFTADGTVEEDAIAIKLHVSAVKLERYSGGWNSVANIGAGLTAAGQEVRLGIWAPGLTEAPVVAWSTQPDSVDGMLELPNVTIGEWSHANGDDAWYVRITAGDDFTTSDLPTAGGYLIITIDDMIMSVKVK